jgi:hypothetical protein
VSEAIGLTLVLILEPYARNCGHSLNREFSLRSS